MKSWKERLPEPSDRFLKFGTYIVTAIYIPYMAFYVLDMLPASKATHKSYITTNVIMALVMVVNLFENYRVRKKGKIITKTKNWIPTFLMVYAALLLVMDSLLLSSYRYGFIDSTIGIVGPFVIFAFALYFQFLTNRFEASAEGKNHWKKIEDALYETPSSYFFSQFRIKSVLGYATTFACIVSFGDIFRSGSWTLLFGFLFPSGVMQLRSYQQNCVKRFGPSFKNRPLKPIEVASVSTLFIVIYVLLRYSSVLQSYLADYFFPS